jgi:hypothetical protein
LVELRRKYPRARVEVPPEIRPIIGAEDKKGAEKLQRLWHSVLAASEGSAGERS